MDLGLIGGAAAGLVVVAGIAWLFLSRKTPSLDDIEPEDGSRCLACDNTELERPAEGVYICRCGHQGGPGLPAYVWQKKTEAVGAMSSEQRASKLADAHQSATLAMVAARGDVETVARLFAEAESITPIGKHAANRKRELYREADELLPSAEGYVMQAIGAVETERLYARGGERMADWYDRLNGSRRSVYSATLNAAAAIGPQLRELQEVVAALEAEHAENQIV